MKLWFHDAWFRLSRGALIPAVRVALMVGIVVGLTFPIRGQAPGEPAAPPKRPSGKLTKAHWQELYASRDSTVEGIRLLGEGKAKEALPILTQANEVVQRLLGPDHLASIAGLNNLAGAYRGVGDFAKAEALYLRAIAAQERVQGPKHIALANTLKGLGMLYYSTGNRDKALASLSRALAIVENEKGPDDPYTARLLNTVALAHHAKGNFATAEPMFLRSLKVLEEKQGPDHLDTITTQNNLALLYDEKGEYDKAEPLYLHVLAIKEKVFGPQHPDVAQALSNLAIHYSKISADSKAEPLFRRALEIREKLHGPEHPETANMFQHLGITYKRKGDFDKAEPLLIRALNIFKKVFGAGHSRTAAAMDNLASLYQWMGDYEKAEPLFRRALEIREKVLGPNDPDTASSLGSLAGLHQDNGNYAEAESLATRALAITEKRLGPHHPDTATHLNNLAGLYRTMSDYAKAEPLYLRALKITETTFGPDHLRVANNLNNLALLHGRLGDPAKAKEFLTRAAEIEEKSLGANHPELAATLGNLAGKYQDLGDYDNAEPIMLRALAIFQNVMGPNHPRTAIMLNNLASLYSSMGDAEKAEKRYLESLAIREKVLGPNHPATADCLTNLASLYRSLGNYAKAEPLERRALTTSLNHLDMAAYGQSERQQLVMAAHFRYRPDGYLSIAVPAQKYDETAYGFILAWRGRILMRQRLQRAAADDPQVAETLLQLQQVATRLSTLALRTPSTQQRDAWQRQIEEYSQKKERLEQDLARASAAFRSARRATTPQQMQAALPDETALVEFVNYVRFADGDSNEMRVAAFVLNKHQPVKLLDLASLKEVDDAIVKWRGGRFGTSPAAQQASSFLRQKIWLPLEPYLTRAKTVLVAPDGPIGELPFGALPGRQPGTYLIEDYSLAVVPVPTVLANPLNNGRRDQTAKGLLAVGDVNYDQQSLPQTLVASNVSPSQRAVVGAERPQFAPLKGTGPEVLAVGRAFRTAFPEVKPIRLRGEQATEAAFRAAAPQYRYLHLATHGYFAHDSIRAALSRDVQQRDAQQTELATDQSLAGYHPGLLSGIVLSGANQPPDKGDDGILTAAEVQAMDLRRVQLVTLSACETGLGEFTAGEGLLGLQRAFQAAGAKHVVASLWSVDDAATQALMGEFYRNLWQKSMSEAEALRQAQLTMLQRYDPTKQQLSPRGLKLLPDNSGEAKPPARLAPYYWAAFVLSGTGK